MHAMHVATPEDRSIAVPPGHLVRTGYVPMHRVRLLCENRMAFGDIEAAGRRQLALGASQAFPPPLGRWDGEWFWILDGRHQFVAALALRFRYLLVAWMEGPG